MYQVPEGSGPWGDYALNCAERPGFKQPHELLVRSLGRLLALGNIAHSINDQNVQLLVTQGAGVIRPANLLLPSWAPEDEGNPSRALAQAAARKVGNTGRPVCGIVWTSFPSR